MDMNGAVAKAIGAERSIAEMTVKQLSDASGIPARSLMRVLGAERDIKVNQVADLAAALGVYPHELIEHAEQILARSSRDRGNVVTLRRPVGASVEYLDLEDLPRLADAADDAGGISHEDEDAGREEQS
ncbi:hypothetical protein [Xylanimonas ulmi]|uniref:Cro/C1-type helix-turn-helix DNA-binding protein n=1 Tax=Xylanimonas ulmi TaxID=228973 RepID=A0A4Q7M4U5_9MICO|nr:hypothetical protein [Xylanibacterium ulmi]RZS61652.1 hypothetical protein EV386_1962 [Xylanibacterium ulmi]